MTRHRTLLAIVVSCSCLAGCLKTTPPRDVTPATPAASAPRSTGTGGTFTNQNDFPRAEIQYARSRTISGPGDLASRREAQAVLHAVLEENLVASHGRTLKGWSYEQSDAGFYYWVEYGYDDSRTKRTVQVGHGAISRLEVLEYKGSWDSGNAGKTLYRVVLRGRSGEEVTVWGLDRRRAFNLYWALEYMRS